MRPRSAITAVVICWTLFTGSFAAEPPVAYRRVFVPADNPSAWPRGDQSYLPVETSDFEAWIATANAPPAAATVTEARYEARLEGGELKGSGTWHVELTGKAPARIVVSDSSILFQNARWRGDSAVPVRVGWWPIDGSDEIERALEVPQSGDLEFDWHVRAASGAVGVPEYSLPLSTAARTRFVLDLPAGKQPLFTGGVILESPVRPENGGRWIVALRPNGRATLQLHDLRRQAVSSPASPHVRQELGYQLSLRGSELRARLHIDAGESAIHQLKIVVPPGMKLVEASCGERPLPWRIQEGQSGSTSSQVVLELGTDRPEQVVDVSLLCWGPPVVGEPLKLPMLSVRDAFWTSGRIDVAIDDALEPGELKPVDCVQTAVDAVATELGPSRRMSFTAFAPAAAVEVVLAERPARGFVRMGTTLAVGNPRITARTIAEVSVERGSLRRLSANLQPGWSIDAIETVPAEALGEWYVERSGGSHVLDLQLHQAVTPDHPMRIVLSGRFERASSVDPLSVAKLNALTWRGLSTTRKLLQLRAAEQFELEVAADLQMVAVSTLSAFERALFAQPDGGPVCDLAASPPAAAIRLTPKQGTYDATIQIDAQLRQGRLWRAYRVECRPRGSGVDHVLVYLSQPTARPLEWCESDSDARLSAERMPESDPRLGGLPRGGELWLVDLGHLYVRPFAITADSTQPWSRRDRVPLAALPDAASQQGRVTVSSTAVELPTIVAQGMSPTSLPIDFPAGAPEDSATVRAVYRFQPTRFYDASQAAQLWIGPATTSTEGAKLIATHVDVDSRYAADGSGVHRATYSLQNLGLRSLELKLPQGVRLDSARVDGEHVTPTSQEKIALMLPHRSEFSLELELTSRQPSLASGHRISSPLPGGAVAIVAGRWRVSLPHGFEATERLTSENQTPDLRERWFGPLARRQDDRPFNPFAAQDWNAMWAGLSRAVSTPALAQTQGAEEERPWPTGWHAIDREFFAGPPAAITIAHRPATSAIGLALFLACATLPRLIHMRGLAIVLLAVVAAAVSLFLPAFYAPLGAAATLGFGAAALWQAWQRMSWTSRSVVAAAAIVVSCSPIAVAAGPPAAIEQVLVPVDAAGQLAGTKCFVSSDFLRQLMRPASATSAAASWLITDMRCDGELVQGQDPQPGPRPANWTLTLEIETFVRDAAIRLPLRKDEADWPSSASVDGIPGPLAWGAADRQCSIRVAEPGRHQVSVAFVPRVVTAASRQTISLTLPQIPGAAVSIAAPAALAELRDEQRTYVRHDESNRVVWRSELDASGQMTASWNARLADATTTANRGVDQLSSLRIEPDALLLTTRLRRHERGEWPATIELALDNHWELQADRTVTQAAEAEVLSDGRKLLRVPMEQGVADSLELILHFRSSNVSSLGRILFPTVQPTSLNVESHFIAVTCDPALECVPSHVPPAVATPPAEFAAAGLAGEPSPQLLLDASKVEPNWYLTIRPRETASSCEDRLSLAASKRQLRVNYRCDVTPRAADRFGWSLAVPAQLRVERVTVTSGGDSVPIDWTRRSPTRLAIHFSRAATKTYEVELVGSIPLAAGGRTPFPQIGPPRPSRADQIVDLYRDENVLARWQLPPEMATSEVSASQSSPFGEPVRFVGTHRIKAESASKSFILVEPNRPIVRGDTLTVVARHDDTWRATFQASLRVERGVVDVLRLQTPANWVGPFEVTPAANTRVDSATGSSTLVIRLPQAISAGESIQLSVDSPLTTADGEVPVAPRIQLTHAGERREFLALPATVGGQTAAWTRRGVEPAEIPELLRKQAAAPADVETFRVAADSIYVALRPRTSRASSANVRLAETAVRVAPDGGMVTITRFVVAPEGLSDCLVRLPDDSELVRLQLDGHAALARALDPRKWQVQLGPPDLPQVLEVVTRSYRKTGDSSGVVELDRPTLESSGEPIPVEFSLWTLRLTGASGTPHVTGGSLVPPDKLAAARFDRLLSISQSATRSVIESPLVDGYHWFARWSSGLDAAARMAGTLERQSAGASAAIRVPQPDESFAETMARYEAWLDQINEIFAAAEWSAVASPAAATGVFGAGNEIETDVGDRVCFISDGNEQRVRVEFVPPGMSPIATRIALLVSLAAVGVVADWLARRPRLFETLEIWPEAAGLALGLTAWAWLRPSALGLLLAATCAALLVRRVFGARKSPRHDSSNQPSENAEHLA